MTALFIQTAILIWGYMTFWYLVSLKLKRGDIADTAWGLGFPTIAIYLFLKSDEVTIVMQILFVLILLWGVRLAFHISSRNAGKKEDYRYAKWRRDWGQYYFVISYVQIFMLQGFFMLLISLPLIFSTANPHYEITPWVFIGIAVWVIGFVFEAVGDFQLSQFLKNPDNKGKIMQSGLWKYTRHPNYFGEISMWWGIFFISSSSGLVSILSPLTITILLLFVSGIPMLEAKFAGNKDFEEYKRKTSVFLPLPPRK